MHQNYDSLKTDNNKVCSKTELRNELQAHQNELEKQNRILIIAQQQLEEARDRYADLYDNAPVGYLTLDKAGTILAINLTGSTMLGIDRASIVNNSFVSYIAPDDSHAFLYYLKQIFYSSNNTITELRVKGPLGRAIHVRLESAVVKDKDVCRMVMTNINLLKEATSRNQELLHGNRRLMQNLFKMQEEERRLLARELHDELGQWLTAIHAETVTIVNSTEKNSSIAISARAIKECVKKMHEVMHNMLHQLRPALLDTLGLEDALLELKNQWDMRNFHIDLELKLEGKFDQLGEHINITIFRIVQEALNNVCNHAEANQVIVRLNRKMSAFSADDVLSLSIEDNGKGYNVEQTSKGLGVLGMRERAIAAGGKFSVRSAANYGTQIYVKLPLDNTRRRRKTDDL